MTRLFPLAAFTQRYVTAYFPKETSLTFSPFYARPLIKLRSTSFASRLPCCQPRVEGRGSGDFHFPPLSVVEKARVSRFKEARSADFPLLSVPLASRLPGYNGIDIPLGDKPHNPLASVGHLQSSVSSRARPVHFPRLCVAASRSDSKYLDNLGHLAIISIDRSVRRSIIYRNRLPRRKKSKKKEKGKTSPPPRKRRKRKKKKSLLSLDRT